jgi:hypothetical protein
MKHDKYAKRYRESIKPELFKAQIIGEFYEPQEITWKRNRASQELWGLFSKICHKIMQPCAPCKAEAEPGDWYLSLCDDKNWHIFEMSTDDDSPVRARRVFNIPGLRSGDLMETLLYVDAFIFRYNANCSCEAHSGTLGAQNRQEEEKHG